MGDGPPAPIRRFWPSAPVPDHWVVWDGSKDKGYLDPALRTPVPTPTEPAPMRGNAYTEATRDRPALRRVRLMIAQLPTDQWFTLRELAVRSMVSESSCREHVLSCVSSGVLDARATGRGFFGGRKEFRRRGGYGKDL